MPIHRGTEDWVEMNHPARQSLSERVRHRFGLIVDVSWSMVQIEVEGVATTD